MATFEFRLPDIGEGVMEGEIVKWLVKPGDVIKEDAPVVEVMTDKATVTIPTPKGGTVLKIYGAEGDLAKVHHPLVDLEVSGAAPASVTKVEPAPQKAASAPVAAPSNGEKVLATPVTRRMAKEHNVDLAQISGSGPQGRVLKTDVESFLSGQSAQAPAKNQNWSALSVAASDERIPLRGLRKKIAEKMVRSAFTAPHYAFVEEVDASALVALRNSLNEKLAAEKVKLSFLPFFVKAVISAFRKFPQVNANMDEATQELIVRGERNIGIAVMTEQGLMVPVMKQADRISLRGVSEEVTRLASAARDHKLKLEELSGGTFTITSLGQTGGLFATPIINHPEVAIMGVHRMSKRPWVNEKDEIVVKPMMNLSFCFDHRVIDGATGAEFAYEVIKYIERPELLFIDMV